jgi:hypothetical protein
MNTTEPGEAGAEAEASLRGRQARRNRRGLSFRVAAIVTTSVLSTLLCAGISYSADGNTTHQVTWLHESPSEVTSFVIFVSAVEGSPASARQINVGKPGGSGSGSAQFYSALVPISASEYVAVAAIGRNGLLSSLSVWSRPQPSQPGQPLVVQP